MNKNSIDDVCPICGNCDGFRNIGRVHWAFCGDHKVKWLYGENIFSGWQDESPEMQADSFLMLAQFREVGSL